MMPGWIVGRGFASISPRTNVAQGSLPATAVAVSLPVSNVLTVNSATVSDGGVAER